MTSLPINNWRYYYLEGLPLHQLCANEMVQLDRLEYIVAQNPDAVKVKTKFGDLPIHLLCLNRRVSGAMIKVLLNHYPESLKEKNGKGQNRDLPIHLLCYNIRVSCAMVKVLLNHYPESVKETNGKGQIPLHLACDNPLAPNDLKEYLMRLHPDGVEKRTGAGDLPMHIICKQHASLDLIKNMFENYPDAVKERDSRNEFPLHIICDYRGPDESIRFLIDMYPAAVQEKNRRGELPLHLACQGGPSYDVIKYLLLKYPEAIRKKDERGKIPLHNLIYSYNSLCDYYANTVACLLVHHPCGINERDNDGDSPLHSANYKSFGLPIPSDVLDMLNFARENVTAILRPIQLVRILLRTKQELKQSTDDNQDHEGLQRTITVVSKFLFVITGINERRLTTLRLKMAMKSIDPDPNAQHWISESINPATARSVISHFIGPCHQAFVRMMVSHSNNGLDTRFWPYLLQRVTLKGDIASLVTYDYVSKMHTLLHVDTTITANRKRKSRSL